MSDPIRILICPLSVHERDGWWHPELGKFVADLPHMGGYVTAVLPIHNFIPAAAGRNYVCKRVANEEPDRWDWLLMIDNDMAPPFNLLDTVKDAPDEAWIVVPQFSVFFEYQKKLMLGWNVMGKPEADFSLPLGFHELNKCGTGAIFIRPKALVGFPQPYFDYTRDENGSCTGSEDIYFCEKARGRGIRIFGNNRIKVGHYKSVNLEVMAQMLYSEKVLDGTIHSGVSSDSSEGPSVKASPAIAVTA